MEKEIEYEKIWKNIELDLIKNNDELKRNKLITSSNLYNFLPDIQNHNFDELYKKIKYNQLISSLEEHNISRISEILVKNFNSKKKYHSNIFCTYHFASYRLTCHLLSYLNIDYKLVIAEKTYNNQGQKFINGFKKLKEKYNLKSTFSIINAETKNGFFEMISTLKNGGNLLFYIDGNTGIKENKKNLIRINLLNNNFYSRKGIAYLSLLTQSNIIPVIMDRKNNINEIVFYDEINSDKLDNNENNQKFICQEIYSILESKLKEKPEYWECWLYLNDFTEINSLIENQPKFKPGFNNLRFEVVLLKDEYFLYDRYKYIFTPISKEFYNHFKNNDLNLTIELVSILISKKIILE